MRISKLLLASAAFVAIASTASATSVSFGSSTGTVNNSGGPSVLATTDASWAPALAGSAWITAGPNDPAIGSSVIYTVTITLPVGFSDAILNLGAYADDSAAVVLDGTTLIAENTTLGSHCASGPIGCTSGTEGVISNLDVTADLHAGANTLTFQDFQEVNNTPFGVDFAGSLSYQPGGAGPGGTTVPEPSTIALFGAGIMAFAGFVGLRRRKMIAR